MTTQYRNQCRRGCRALLVATALSVMALGGASARADRRGDVEQLAKRAREHFKAGRFEKAVAFYVRAYQTLSAAAVLYNIAFIYDRKLGEPELALSYYRRYVRAVDAEPNVVTRALKRITQLKQREKVDSVGVSKLAAPKARSTQRPPGTSAAVARSASGAAAKPGAAPRRSLALVPSGQQGAAQRRGSGRRLAGWITAGSGAALLIAGVAFAAVSNSAHDDFESGVELQAKRDARDRGRLMALTADVLFGVGGAAVITGAALLLWPSSDERPRRTARVQRSLRVGAIAGPGGAMFTLGGAL